MRHPTAKKFLMAVIIALTMSSLTACYYYDGYRYRDYDYAYRRDDYWRYRYDRYRDWDNYRYWRDRYAGYPYASYPRRFDDFGFRD